MRIIRMMLFVAVSVCMLSAAVVLAKSDEERQDVLYYCNCGEECHCNSVGTSPGNCKCGKPMKWGHVLKVEGDTALVCTCGKGCKCSLHPDDPTKCGCGNPVKKVNLKGTGIYFCNCGGACTCNTVSDKPGKCKCGMDLKKSD